MFVIALDTLTSDKAKWDPSVLWHARYVLAQALDVLSIVYDYFLPIANIFMTLFSSNCQCFYTIDRTSSTIDRTSSTIDRMSSTIDRTSSACGTRQNNYEVLQGFFLWYAFLKKK